MTASRAPTHVRCPFICIVLQHFGVLEVLDAQRPNLSYWLYAVAPQKLMKVKGEIRKKNPNLSNGMQAEVSLD